MPGQNVGLRHLGPADPSTALSTGLFFWARSTTSWLPAEIEPESRRRAMISQLAVQDPIVLERLPRSVLTGSTLSETGKLYLGPSSEVGPTVNAGAGRTGILSPLPLPGTVNAEGECTNAHDAGWPRSPGKQLQRSDSMPSVAMRAGSPKKSPRDFLNSLQGMSFGSRMSFRGRRKSLEDASPSSSRPASALMNLIQADGVDSVQGTPERQQSKTALCSLLAVTTGEITSALAGKSGDKIVDEVREAWSAPTGDDKLRRQLMMDRVGALARSLGRPNHGMIQLKSTNTEADISDISEIMSYALGPSASQDENSRKQRGWLAVAFDHMKVGVTGQPEATCSRIILGIATLIGLLGYDGYYMMATDTNNDDKMLTVIFCVLCIFLVEFYCMCACTQGNNETMYVGTRASS
jgi:hypothetical protein